MMEEAVGNAHPDEVDAVLTVDLTSCQQYWVFYSHAHEVELGGPEYAYPLST